MNMWGAELKIAKETELKRIDMPLPASSTGMLKQVNASGYQWIHGSLIVLSQRDI